ncbi:MAG: capsule assembly Wzi family protein [Melioribacteraceae bacterium]|nr:capsule assembly Wzi family protein [Melioribacteraceae bacterium]
MVILYKLYLYLSLFTLPFSLLYAQVVFVPVNNNIYHYLDRMNVKGVIQLDSEVKSFSRIYIAEKIIEIKSKYISSPKNLTNIDLELLDFYSAEYGYEMYRLQKNTPEFQNSKISKESNLQSFKHSSIRLLSEASHGMPLAETTFFAKDPFGRIRLLIYEDSLFSFKLSPIAAYSISKNGSKTGHQRSGGLSLYISSSDWFGGALNMSDNGEFGENIDRNKYLTPQRGADFVGAPDGIEFSDVRAQINFNWNWGVISLKKDYSEWGNGYFGNVILSDKAPSYPSIYLELKPAKWFRFYYQFSWLHSGVIDSGRTIVVSDEEDFYVAHERFVKKYMVINMMTVSPWSIFDFSIGNAAVYAGDIRPEMFIPFNFYKYMDRDTGKKSVEDSNGMLFFDFALRYPQTFKFYVSLFVDVTSIREILNSEFYSTWTGTTIGGKKTDLFLDNLDLTIEYTKITPWVYEHRYGGLTNYQHINYSLGHWIGQNSDQFKIQFNYQPIRGLRTQLYTEWVRKGGLKTIDEVYQNKEDLPFLYSPVRKDFYLGLDASYEVIHELFIEGSYRYSNITDEDEKRTENFILGPQNNFSIGFRYGTP